MEIITIKGWVKTDKVGSECQFEAEFPVEEWQEMTEQERDAAMLDALFESGVIEWSWDE